MTRAICSTCCGTCPRLKQGSLLPEAQAAEAPTPARLGFTTWRVNDYDLQIQHNEAVALACEHIGVQRTRTDAFFATARSARRS